ncbi:MAG: uroporphyrinogen decarboxylase family protein, partial [Armatimonadota bacterium]|nr:uroporphyrinogen decarboxylase family protein [Armatimonadota bacterium]
MQEIDFEAHNREVKEVWDAYYIGKPIRVPMILGLNVRYYLFTSWLNPRQITFQEYSEDPELMLETQLEFQYYVRHNLLQDAEMGMPKQAWHAVYVDLQNTYEASWFGCPIRYYDGQVPDTEPILSDSRKRMLFDKGMPDPFKSGSMEKNLRFYEKLKDKIRNFTFMGLPVSDVIPSGLGTDGPFTAAVNLRGATKLCMDIYDDPEYVHELLKYITEATITRIKAWRKMLGHELKPKCWGIADDSIQLLSCEAYREFVLPYHKRL